MVPGSLWPFVAFETFSVRPNIERIMTIICPLTLLGASHLTMILHTDNVTLAGLYATECLASAAICPSSINRRDAKAFIPRR